MLDCILFVLGKYGILFFGTIAVVLCIGLQVVDFINWISGNDEHE